MTGAKTIKQAWRELNRNWPANVPASWPLSGPEEAKAHVLPAPQPVQSQKAPLFLGMLPEHRPVVFTGERWEHPNGGPGFKIWGEWRGEKAQAAEI